MPIVRLLALALFLVPCFAQTASWQVRVATGDGVYRRPSPGYFPLDYLADHILPLDGELQWLSRHAAFSVRATQTEKVGTMRERKVYYLLHHVTGSYYSFVKEIDIEQGADLYSPVVYLASNALIHPNVRAPWIIERSGHQVLTSCDRVSGTGRFYTRYDLIFDGDQIRDIEMSGRFQELADANKPAGAESCRPLLYFDSEGRDCKGVDLETMTYRCIFPKTQTVLEMGVKLEDVTFVPVSVKSMSYRELEDREHP